MILLALDLATQTGWCCGDTDPSAGLPTLGTVRMPSTGEEAGPFLDFFHRWMDIQMEFWTPDMIIMEAPIIVVDKRSGRVMSSISTTRKLQGLAAHLEYWAHINGIEIAEVAASTAKKALGHGKFKKDDMMAATRRCGLSPASEDEADAFGVWMAGLKELDKASQQHWDTLLYTGPRLT